MFQGLNVLEFTEKFSTDDKCREYLAAQKWEKGYQCGNCSHNRYYNEKKKLVIMALQVDAFGIHRCYAKVIPNANGDELGMFLQEKMAPEATIKNG